jgi:hypothetical protein
MNASSVVVGSLAMNGTGQIEATYDPTKLPQIASRARREETVGEPTVWALAPPLETVLCFIDSSAIGRAGHKSVNENSVGTVLRGRPFRFNRQGSYCGLRKS